MILGFTGTLQGMTEEQKTAVTLRIAGLCPLVLIHGGAIGADRDIHGIALHYVINTIPRIIEVYPENVTVHRSAAYWSHPARRIAVEETGRQLIVHPARKPLKRNHIIAERCDRLLATPATSEEQLRSGTWATIRYARKMGKPITIIRPDGTIENS
jgi:predicted Rossmann fold nucleotide-binding protein DprA/Smf involved in DNA uptake